MGGDSRVTTDPDMGTGMGDAKISRPTKTTVPSEEQDKLVQILDEYATAVYVAARDDTDPPDVDVYAQRIRAALSEQEPVAWEYQFPESQIWKRAESQDELDRLCAIWPGEVRTRVLYARTHVPKEET